MNNFVGCASYILNGIDIIKKSILLIFCL